MVGDAGVEHGDDRIDLAAHPMAKRRDGKAFACGRLFGSPAAAVQPLG